MEFEKMEIEIFQYKPSDFDKTKIIQREFLSFLFSELNKLPWFNLDVDNELQLAMSNLDSFAEPNGRLFLVETDGQLAGTISLRKIRENCGEIKRMYVRPQFSGKKIGTLMIDEVIQVSKNNGYSDLYLDTAQFMSSAVSLYKKFGFHETEPYPESVNPEGYWEKWIFMTKKL